MIKITRRGLLIGGGAAISMSAAEISFKSPFMQFVALEGPPRSGKTTFAIDRIKETFRDNPAASVLVCSYSDSLSSMIVRNIGLKRKQDNNSKFEVETPEGGHLVAAQCGGALVGRGSDLIVIDQPVRTHPQSRMDNKAIWDWFTSSFMTRLNHPANGRVLVTATKYDGEQDTSWGRHLYACGLWRIESDLVSRIRKSGDPRWEFAATAHNPLLIGDSR